MPVQDRAVATRRSLLLAAAEVFAESGYEAATIAAVLDRAGVTKGALYFHFGSKQELATAIMTERKHWVPDGPIDPASPLQDLVDMSFVFCSALQRDPLTQASIRLTIERATFTATPLRDRMYSVWVNRSQESVRLAQDVGQVAGHWQAADLAGLVVASMTGLQLASQVASGRADLLERVHLFWQVFAPAVVVAGFTPTLRIRPPGGSRGASDPS